MYKLINFNNELETSHNNEIDFFKNARFIIIDYIKDCMINNSDNHDQLLKWLKILECAFNCYILDDLKILIKRYELPFNVKINNDKI